MPPPSGQLNDDAVEQIKARLSLLEVVQDYVPLRRSGGSRWQGLCPFHQEDTPSFGVNPKMQHWHCFGCEKKGDMFDFIQEIEKVDFKGALEILAERAHVELRRDDPRAAQRSDRKKRVLEMNRLAAQFYEYVLHSLPAGEPGRALLAQRQVGEETARRFQLGYAPGGRAFSEFVRSRSKPVGDARDAGLIRSDGSDFFQDRLVIPIRDERGHPLAFTGRTVRQDEPKKYINSPDTEVYHKGRVLFALDLAKAEISARGSAVLMEGQFDVITAHHHGVGNAVASSGTALTEEQILLLKRFTTDLVLVFDADKAGRQAAFRAVELAAPKGMRTRIATLEGAKDPDEFLRAAGAAAQERWEQTMKGAADGWECMIRDGFEGLRWPDDTVVALQRLDAILAKMPDPRLRDSYRERAGAWFGMPGGTIRVVEQPRRERPGPVAPGGPRRVTTSRLIIQALAARPELAAGLRAELPAAALDEADRPLYLKLLEAIEMAGPDGLAGNLSGFEESERDQIERAWVRPPPGIERDEVIAEYVERLMVQDHRRRVTGIFDALKAAETRGDRETVLRLQAEYLELSMGRQVGKGK